MFLHHLRADALHFGLGLRESHAGFEPREDTQEMIRARLHALRIGIEGKPQRDRLICKAERRWQDADYFSRHAANRNPPTNHVAIGPETLLPEVVIQADHAIASRVFFFRQKAAAQHWLDTEHFEE